MTQKSKKVVESGKDSPEKSPPSSGESELTAALGSRDPRDPQSSDKQPGSNDGTDPDQQRGKKKGTVYLCTFT